ncbi:C40 family peptidase [Actinomadura viridis]|uniref:Cell wall-associated NlpC family hydrolase n=1 Tax=Actinomadura viridis TaxID=58110 RepID=A0A931GK84_9ACTN|nr:NlpC/P60 family protein [Actinomadura viridis]MBG6090573.1 cell wall-associated NlpC family hydrolase [Actinomadura viridis]
MQRGADGGRARLSRLTTTVTWPVTAAMTVAFVAVAPPAAAAPEPSRRELAEERRKLADEAERLTEQYNGLRVRMAQARRAAQAAEKNARRQHEALEEVRAKVATLAADTYKNGGADPSVAFASAADPQEVLDRSATMNYFARQSGTQVALLLQTMQAAERARKAATDRDRQVRGLADEAQRKKKSLEGRLATIERKLNIGAPLPKTGKAPAVDPDGASAKAMGAVKAALAQLGVPYSWGGGTPSGPSFGIAQGSNIKGFDCSGLTMYAYAQVGIKLPHYTGSQFNAGTHVSRSQLRPGDLVFFHQDLHHMGMYIGKGRMVHAPQTGDVIKVSPLSGRPFAGGVRIA